MTEVIVEVGPGTGTGPTEARDELISAALEFIDDELAILDEQLFSVQDLWDELMCTVVGSAADTVVLVCPTWWAPSRIERVRSAASTVTPVVVTLQRTALLRAGAAHPRATIIEITPDFVVVTPATGRGRVVPRGGEPSAIADEVVASVGASTVLVDVPAGVLDAEPVARAIGDRVSATGTTVMFTDDDSLRRVACATRMDQSHGLADDNSARPRWQRRREAAVLAGVVSAVVLGFVLRDNTDTPATDTMTLLVEGRIGVMVPARWAARRVTSGPGSARLQIVSSDDTDVALHITQSTDGGDLLATAAALRLALGHQPDGVFVDFNASAHRAGKDAVTYRELREGRQVDWAVFVEDTVRVAIGCQSAPGRAHLVRAACDQAIGSAHAVF